jgi:hypothetical protein
MKGSRDKKKQDLNSHVDEKTLDLRQACSAQEETIHEILKKVIKKLEPELIAGQDANDAGNEDLEKTAILSPRGATTEGRPSMKEKDSNDLPATIIITPSNRSKDVSRGPAIIRADNLERRPRTALEQDMTRDELAAREINKPIDQDFVTETVILKPVKGEDKKQNEKKHSPMLIEAMAEEIKTIYKSDRQSADTLIETLLAQRLKDDLPQERMAILQDLARQLEVPDQRAGYEHNESEELLQLYSLLLGKKIAPGCMSSEEMNKQLAFSLNTIFDTINDIITVIHTTLLGEKAELQTIREIIGSQLSREGTNETLQSYLDQIKDAFLLAHRAFQESVNSKTAQLLDELNPDHISEAVDRGFKLGPLYKAQLFELYKERYRVCKNWFESNRFTEEFLREFEKNCQKFYQKRKRSTS